MKYSWLVALGVTGMLFSGCGSHVEFRESEFCCDEFVDSMRVMTLNLAHGRGLSFHQAAVHPNIIRANLDRVVDVTADERVDVAGFQEADGAAHWSGGFDHVEYVAEGAGFSWWIRGDHARIGTTRYGTAIVGRQSASEADAVNFRTFGPGFKKGYTISTVMLDGEDVDVVSVHLDPLLGVRRRKQVKQIIEHLDGRSNPVVIVGDLNVEWKSNGPIEMLADGLDLEVYRPWADNLTTFKGKRRLDWILISEDTLDFDDYYVVDREVSDHQAVVADISLER